jgi:hypothetical protein
MGSQMAFGQETLFTSAVSDNGLLPYLLYRSCGRCEDSLWHNSAPAIIPTFRLKQIREREVRTTRIVRAMTANTVMGHKSPRRLCRAAKNPTPAGPDSHCNQQTVPRRSTFRSSGVVGSCMCAWGQRNSARIHQEHCRRYSLGDAQ